MSGWGGEGSGEPPDAEERLGDLAAYFSMVTPEQLQACLELQAREKAAGKLPQQLGLILLSKGFVDESQLQLLLVLQQFRRLPGASRPIPQT